jgi:hypothetical protein
VPKKPPPVLTIREALAWYRSAVERAGRGERLTSDECQQVDTALGFLGLPGYAWSRDVAACQRYARLDDGHLRDELLVIHPHVLLPLDQAEQLWTATREHAARRRQQQTA